MIMYVQQLRTVQVHVRAIVAASNALSARVDQSLDQLSSSGVHNGGLERGGLGASAGMAVDQVECLSALLHERARELGALKPLAGEDDATDAETMPPVTPKPFDDSSARVLKGARRASKATLAPGKTPHKTPKGKLRVGKNTPDLKDWSAAASVGTGAFLSAIHDLRMAARERLITEFAIPYYDSLHNKPPLRTDLVPDSVQAFVGHIEGRFDDIFDRAVAYQRQYCCCMLFTCFMMVVKPVGDSCCATRVSDCCCNLRHGLPRLISCAWSKIRGLLCPL